MAKSIPVLKNKKAKTGDKVKIGDKIKTTKKIKTADKTKTADKIGDKKNRKKADNLKSLYKKVVIRRLVMNISKTT